MLRYLDHSHSHTDPQDDPDVCDEPTLHAGSTTLENNISRESGPQRKSSEPEKNNNVIYRVIHGPVRRLGLTEAAVGDVSGGDGHVLTGAGEQQHGAVHDDHVPVPVLMATPATTLHLQDAVAKNTALHTHQILHSLPPNNWISTGRPLVATPYTTLFFREYVNNVKLQQRVLIYLASTFWQDFTFQDFCFY